MQEYPKALYFGTVQAHQHKIVNGAEDEAELRELGFVDFADLEKETVKSMDESASSSTSSEDFKNAFVPIEQFDDVCEKLVQTETQLGVAQNERDFYIKENEDLKAQLSQTHQNTSLAPDYSNATAKELREALDAKGIKYLQRDSVETLRALLTQPVQMEE